MEINSMSDCVIIIVACSFLVIYDTKWNLTTPVVVPTEPKVLNKNEKIQKIVFY